MDIEQLLRDAHVGEYSYEMVDARAIIMAGAVIAQAIENAGERIALEMSAANEEKGK